MIEIEKGKPIVLKNGSTILPGDGSGSIVISAEDAEQEKENQKIVNEITDLLQSPFDNEHSSSVRRSLADISIDFNHMNVIMLVFSYNTWGLDDHAIARILGVDTHQIDAIKSSDIYNKTREEFLESLRYAEQASVHGYIQAKAQTAAKVLVSSLTSRKEENRIAAAKDLLDRGGFRPADRVEHSVKFEDELRIRYVQDDSKIPTIELEVENVDGYSG